MLWSAASPARTYGDEVCGMVRRIDREAVVVDTRVVGRMDLVGLCWRLYRESQAEAVFVISNPTLTKRVVYAMESRGVPAFGPIWDS